MAPVIRRTAGVKRHFGGWFLLEKLANRTTSARAYASAFAFFRIRGAVTDVVVARLDGDHTPSLPNRRKTSPKVTYGTKKPPGFQTVSPSGRPDSNWRLLDSQGSGLFVI